MKREPVIEKYKAADGWRWRLVASNGKIVADQHGASRAIALVQALFRRPLKVVRL